MAVVSGPVGRYERYRRPRAIVMGGAAVVWLALAGVRGLHAAIPHARVRRPGGRDGTAFGRAGPGSRRRGRRADRAAAGGWSAARAGRRCRLAPSARVRRRPRQRVDQHARSVRGDGVRAHRQRARADLELHRPTDRVTTARRHRNRFRVRHDRPFTRTHAGCEPSRRSGARQRRWRRHFRQLVQPASGSTHPLAVRRPRTVCTRRGIRAIRQRA